MSYRGNGDSGTFTAGMPLIIDALAEARVQRRIDQVHHCARCGHRVEHAEAGELRRLAREHARTCHALHHHQ